MHLDAFTYDAVRRTLGNLGTTIGDHALLLGAAVFTFVDHTLFLGDYRHVLFIWLAVLLDTLLGLTVAWRTHHVQSREFWRVVPKLAVYLCMYIGAVLVDRTLPTFLQFADSFTAFFIISTEVISIFENTGKLGYATPHFILNRLHVLRSGNITPLPHASPDTELVITLHP